MLIRWTLQEEGIEMDTEHAYLSVYCLLIYFVALGLDLAYIGHPLHR